MSTENAQLPEPLLTYEQAHDVGAHALARRWLDDATEALDHRVDVAAQLTEAATMAALAGWLHRWLPITIHHALLAGATPVQVAAATGLDVDAVAERWREWSQRQLIYVPGASVAEHRRVARIIAPSTTRACGRTDMPRYPYGVPDAPCDYCGRLAREHAAWTPRLTTSDGAREIIAAGGRVHRDDRYSGDYRYIVDHDPRVDEDRRAREDFQTIGAGPDYEPCTPVNEAHYEQPDEVNHAWHDEEPVEPAAPEEDVRTALAADLVRMGLMPDGATAEWDRDEAYPQPGDPAAPLPAGVDGYAPTRRAPLEAGEVTDDAGGSR